MQPAPMRLLAAGVVAGVALVACGGPREPELGASPTPTEAAPAENVDGILKLGSLVPFTGDLAELGPPQQFGYELAVKQINEAGGVLGENVELHKGDDGTAEVVANTTTDLHLRRNVDAILGPASSRISLAVIDKITGSETVQCSPSNTTADFTTYERSEPGFYFRTAPPDSLQGPALAGLIVEEGFSQVGIIALNDAYGQSFQKALTKQLRELKATMVAQVAYDPEGSEFDVDVRRLADAKPQAVAVIAFPETGSIVLREMIAQGLGPNQIGLFTADGMQSAEVPPLVDPKNAKVLDGTKGTAPSSQGSEAFKRAFAAFAPEGTAQIFSAHAYDCVNIVALAAEVAGTDDPRKFHREIVGVTKEGETCLNFSSCKALIDEGKDIDYDGASGKLDFIPAGEPSAGIYEIWQFQEGEVKVLRTVTVSERA